MPCSPFSFFKSEKWSGASDVANWIDYKQEDAMLEYVGFEYGSALVNNFSLIFTFVFMAFVHLFMFLIYAMLVKYHVKNWFQK